MIDAFRHSKKSAFLITKPLQLMIALAIAEQDDFENKPTFVIVDLFSGAREVAANLSCDFVQLQRPIYFPSRDLALSYLSSQNFDNIFIDSDVGLKNFLSIALLKINNPQIAIHVYEEGLGTYREDLYSGFKRAIFNRIGVGTYFGACRFVKSIYVFCPQEYVDNFSSNSCRVREIEGGLLKFLMGNSDEFKRLFNFEGVKCGVQSHSICSLYLSGWRVSEEFLDHFQKGEGDLYMKLHPHIKGGLLVDGIQCIDASVPAELVLMDLMMKYQLVNVYDHNSSVRRYVVGSKVAFHSVEMMFRDK